MEPLLSERGSLCGVVWYLIYLIISGDIMWIMGRGTRGEERGERGEAE